MPAATLEALRAAARDSGTVETTREPDLLGKLRELTWQGHLRETVTPRTHLENVHLIRIGKAEIEAQPDGISLGGSLFEIMNLLGFMTRDTLADPQSQAFVQGLEIYEKIMRSGMGYVWQTTHGNTRRDQLAAGRDWVRMNLKAAEVGLGFHPVSQALQEYPEMAEHYAALRALLGTPDGHTLQMLGRLGYGPDVPPSPRWPLDSRVRPSPA